MGVNLGSAWFAETKETKKAYIQIALDDVVTNMYPELKGVRFALYYNNKGEETKENAPDMYLQAYIPRQKNEATQES